MISDAELIEIEHRIETLEERIGEPQWAVIRGDVLATMGDTCRLVREIRDCRKNLTKARELLGIKK